MSPRVEEILNNCNSEKRIELVNQLDNATDLFDLITNYNWGDGFELPLAVMQHKECDLGIALMLFWENDYPQLYYFDPKSEFLTTNYESDEEIEYKIAFCKTVVEGIRSGNFKKGPNEYDTGCFGEHLHPADSRKAKIRKGNTKFKLQEFEEPFLRPYFVEVND